MLVVVRGVVMPLSRKVVRKIEGREEHGTFITQVGGQPAVCHVLAAFITAGSMAAGLPPTLVMPVVPRETVEKGSPRRSRTALGTWTRASAAGSGTTLWRLRERVSLVRGDSSARGFRWRRREGNRRGEQRGGRRGTKSRTM
jgi:hypothetical protein